MPPVPNEEEAIPAGVQREQKWAEILTELHAKPISLPLRAYYKELNEFVPSWDRDDFVHGIKRFADLWGSERVKVFPNKVHGLHTTNSFTKAWNETYSQQPITTMDLDIRLQCPPSWLCGLRDGHWVLIYQSEAPLSQGLNELVQGPTTLDCGMWCQLAIWMGIRGFIGDRLFGALYKFKPGEFILTQTWNKPMNEAGSVGNLLYYFYDDPKTVPSESKARLETKTVFSHPACSGKHPGGMGRLQNLILIDDYHIVFNPESTQNILSSAELDQKLRRAFDDPQSPFDFEKLEFYRKFPEKVHSFRDFPPQSAETIAKEAKGLATSTLSDAQWEASQIMRDYLARGLCRVLNFPRLVSCLQDAEEAYLDGDANYDVLDGVKRAHERDHWRALMSSLLPNGCLAG